MKTLAFTFASVLFFTATASAGDLAVSKSTLQGMGLGTMQQLPDDDGLAVRGKGTSAGVWGGSIASWNGQTATNSYFASSSWMGPNGSSAFGNSLSFGGNFEFGQFSF